MCLPLAGRGWVLDLVASLAWPLLVLSGACVVLALLWRRWFVAALLVASVCIHGWYLFPGRAAEGAGEPDVRLLVHNSGSANPGLERVLAQIRTSGADIVVLVESNPELVRSIRRGGALAETYPHVVAAGPAPGLSAWRLVLSRWALSPLPGEEPGWLAATPAGSLAILPIHPASPRSAGRWAGGNGLVRGAARASLALAEGGTPVAVAGDLNGAPGSWRDRLLHGGGLQRCKPAMRGFGTFPAALPGPLRLSLDDVWVSRGIRVTSWEACGAAGSDHASVLVGLRLGGERSAGQ